jgi:hypothetical protein
MFFRDAYCLKAGFQVIGMAGMSEDVNGPVGYLPLAVKVAPGVCVAVGVGATRQPFHGDQ